MDAAKVQAKEIERGFFRAWRRSVYHAPGPTVKELAYYAEMNKTCFADTASYDDREGHENDDSVDWIPMRRFLRVIPWLSNLEVVDYICSLANCIAIRLKDISNKSTRDVAIDVKEFGEYLSVISDDDTPEAFAVLEREGYEAVRAILATIESKRARLAEPRKKTLRAVAR